MVVKMSAPGRSFGGVADYCLHDQRVPGEPHPESAERVEWTETRNVATNQGDRAARIMAATAEAGPDLKRLAGGAATGRKLEKPVCHYSLNWARDEKPDRQEMRVVDGRGHSGGRWRRERMNPQQEREAIPTGRDGWGGPERERVAWQRAEERTHWARFEQERGKALGELERRSKREWSALYGRQERQREQLGKDCRGVLGRFRAWRELGGGVREIGGAVRGRPEVLGRFRAELEDRLRWERVSLGKEHSEAVRGIESKAGEFYRGGMEGSEKRAREAARSDGLLLDSYRRPDEFYRLKYSMLEERLEQVREIDGEQAYEKMRRAVETARQSRERRGPERGGPERDFGPSR